MDAKVKSPMKALSAGLIMTLVLLAGCGGGGDDAQTGQPPQDGSEQLSFSLNISSYSDQALSGGGSTGLAVQEPQAVGTVSGEMMIVKPDGTRLGPFTFEAEFDDTTLILSPITRVSLDPGLYTFYLLMKLTIGGVTNQFAATISKLFFDLDVPQTVVLNLNPLMIQGVTSVLQLENIVRISFDYPTDIATYAIPRFWLSISIDDTLSGTTTPFLDNTFNITPDSTGPVVVMLSSLPGGQVYIPQCRFLDGSLIRQVCPGTDPPEPTPPDQPPPEVVPVPLDAGATFDPSDPTNPVDSIVFRFPVEVVDEVGGLANLKVVAKLVGPETVILEEELTGIQLSPVTDPDSEPAYEGVLPLTGYTPNPNNTWSLNFFNTATNGQLFAYCASTGLLDATSGSLTCELNFIDQDQTTEFPVYQLSVNVSDGSLVSGAVVLVNGQPAGITGNGNTDPTNLGVFSFFLPAGDYQIQAVHEAVDPYGSGQVISRTSLNIATLTLTADLPQPLVLQLDPLVAPTIEVVSTDPPDNAIDVLTDATVTVNFSADMDPTATGDAFSLTSGATGLTVSGIFDWPASNQLVFTPDVALTEGTAYQVTIAGTATDIFGNAMGTPHSFSFTTVQPPVVITVTGTDPADNATEVPIAGDIQVTFSEAMEQTATQQAFSIEPFVAGSFSWPVPEVMVFTPDQVLNHGTGYGVTIAGSAANLSGNTMGTPHSFSFTTVQAPPASTLTLTASLFRRPRHRVDGFIDLTEPTTIQVPTQDDVELAVDENGDPIGNPDKFLLFVYMGKVKCVYLGGKWKRYYGWVKEHMEDRAFKSPSCNRGVRPGDILTLQPYHKPRDDDDEDDSDRHSEDHHRSFHRSRAEIKARVISGDRHFKETRVQVTIPVIQP